jgi:hypothetical protein
MWKIGSKDAANCDEDDTDRSEDFIKEGYFSPKELTIISWLCVGVGFGVGCIWMIILSWIFHK